MGGFLFKWLIIPFALLSFAGGTGRHPIYVSVTEIEHNAKAKTLEISCKIFTDDFEKTLRAAYKTHVDLLDPKEKAAMDRLVNDYVQKHLKIFVNGAPVALRYLGYEQIEEGIYSYYQADNVPSVKKIAVTDNILYEYNAQQLSLIHVIVGGERKSTKLNNPEDKFSIEY